VLVLCEVLQTLSLRLPAMREQLVDSAAPVRWW